jgi:hypothetical protein
MPSVMDLIKFRDKFVRMPVTMRNAVCIEAVNWLESDQRPKCKPEHLSFLINFENELQQRLNEKTVDPNWFTRVGQTYGSFSFFEAFLRKYG